MSEKEKIIELLKQLKETDYRYLKFLEEEHCKPESAVQNPEFNFVLRHEYKIRINVYSEILDMLESDQDLSNFLDSSEKSKVKRYDETM